MLDCLLTEVKPRSIMRVMTSGIASQGLARILQDEGRKPSWLAVKTGVSRQYVHGVLWGHWPASAKFRAACAEALGRGESELFHASAEADQEPTKAA